MLTPYPWCLVNAPLKTKRWNIINTLHLSYIFILIFNKCHIVKISVKEPRSSGHQERGRHDQDHDDHSGPGGKAHRAVTVVTVTVAEIPNGLSLLINCQAPLQVHDHQSQDSISVMDDIEDEIQEDIQSMNQICVLNSTQTLQPSYLILVSSRALICIKEPTVPDCHLPLILCEPLEGKLVKC